jgi:hypothetical protein
MLLALVSMTDSYVAAHQETRFFDDTPV